MIFAFGTILFFAIFVQIIFNFGFNDRLFKLRQIVKDDRAIFEDITRYMDQVNRDLEKLENRSQAHEKVLKETLGTIADKIRNVVERTEHSIARGPQRPNGT